LHLFILYVFTDVYLTTLSVGKTMFRSVKFGTRDALHVRSSGAAYMYCLRNGQRKL